MKKVFLIGVFFFGFFAANEMSCFAAGRQSSPAQEEVKSQAARALSTKRVVQVKLKSGVVVKGTVQEVATDHFKLKERDSQFLREILFADADTVKGQSRLTTAMKNTGKVFNFIFLTRTGFALTATALAVARLIVWQKQNNSRDRVLITR